MGGGQSRPQRRFDYSQCNSGNFGQDFVCGWGQTLNGIFGVGGDAVKNFLDALGLSPSEFLLIVGGVVGLIILILILK